MNGETDMTNCNPVALFEFGMENLGSADVSAYGRMYSRLIHSSTILWTKRKLSNQYETETVEKVFECSSFTEEINLLRDWIRIVDFLMAQLSVDTLDQTL